VPAFKGAGKVSLIGKAQQVSNFIERQLAVGQVLLGQLFSNLVQQLLKALLLFS
jgi:hypothetical protein